MQAAQTRQGFNAMNVLMMTNLMDKVVAGNSFNVTNPGPAQSGNGGGAGGGGSNSSTGTGSQPSPFSGAGVVSQSVQVVIGLVAAAGLFLSL